MELAGKLSIKQIRAFVAVYRLGRLAAAAQELSVTQSAISVAIRQIEEVLDVRLFDRTTRTLEPTSAAHEAINLAERILQDIERLGTEIRQLGERKRGRVIVAVTPAVAAALLPPTVRKFAQCYPSIRLVIVDCAPDQFLPRIVSEQVEFGIGSPEPGSSEVELQTLLQDRLCLVCSKAHPLARRREVRWRDLQGTPIIAVRPGYGVRRLIDSVANKAGVSLTIAQEVGFISSALWMTASGLGVSIWPAALVRRLSDAQVVLRPLVAPVVERPIYVVLKRGRSLSPASQTFIDLLKTDLSLPAAHRPLPRSATTRQ
jgi:DNA-binding transcriptional LysR family regulator